jgi:hypothetical protein
MIFKAYGGLPITYAPDIGEVVYARRMPTDRWTLAVVLMARRNKEGHARVKVMWLGDDPDAGVQRTDRSPSPTVKHEIGFLVLDPDHLPLIKRVDREDLPIQVRSTRE